MQRSSRLRREMFMFSHSPPHGISCWKDEDTADLLKAKIIGSEGTPYEGGIFSLDVYLPESYPFQPPKLRFNTPIYHPNIDDKGRVCLDTLKMPPQGAWKPSLNVSSVLITIQLLMSEPNPDDPVMADIANEYKYDRQMFIRKAKEMTDRYAKNKLMFFPIKTALNESEPMQISNSEAQVPQCSGLSSNSRKRDHSSEQSDQRAYFSKAKRNKDSSF